MSASLSMSSPSSTAAYACGCVGPQNGQPLCPCKMRGVEIKDGRYVLPARDLGPVRDSGLVPDPNSASGYRVALGKASP